MFIDSTTAISNNTNSVIETDSFNASQIIYNAFCTIGYDYRLWTYVTRPHILPKLLTANY